MIYVHRKESGEERSARVARQGTKRSTFNLHFWQALFKELELVT